MRNITVVPLVAAVFITPLVASAFGVSPPRIDANKLVKGSRYEATIFLVQGQPDQDLEVKAIFDTPEKIAKWLTVDKGEQFVIPKGVQQFPIKVRIQVPENAELGVYHGYLRVNTVPKAKEGDQISISVGARIDINFTVGEGAFLDYVIRRLDILDIEEGDPPQIVVTLENIGNVPARPERATLDLLDKYGNVRLGFAQNEDLPEIPAFETKTFTVEFPIDLKLGIGEYWAEAMLYRDGQVTKSVKTVFNVIEKKINYPIYAGIGVIVILFALFSYRWRKKIIEKNDA
ncbi:MAG: hypothetical protein AAB495_02740 [Patescibacteria group bacterium]